MNFDFTVQPATFVARPNRFRVEAQLEATGQPIAAHCADPGRLRELLIPGVRLHVSPAANPNRKTAFDLRFVEHPEHGRLISLDSRVPNALIYDALANRRLSRFNEYVDFRHEVSAPHHAGDGVRSRFDFCLADGRGRRCWIEVKSATLVEEDGIARFPDAPTERGRRHVEELADLVRSGDHAAVVFVIQRPDAAALEPNRRTDSAFADALSAAKRVGVELIAYTCELTTRQIAIRQEVPVLVST
jgi:sugar fermentation stimulation protein A